MNSNSPDQLAHALAGHAVAAALALHPGSGPWPLTLTTAQTGHDHEYDVHTDDTEEAAEFVHYAQAWALARFEGTPAAAEGAEPAQDYAAAIRGAQWRDRLERIWPGIRATAAALLAGAELDREAVLAILRQHRDPEPSPEAEAITPDDELTAEALGIVSALATRRPDMVAGALASYSRTDLRRLVLMLAALVDLRARVGDEDMNTTEWAAWIREQQITL